MRSSLWIVGLVAVFVLGGCELFSANSPAVIEFVHVPPGDVGEVPDSVKARYREDAAQLTLRLEEADGSDAILLPEATVTSIYNALLRVYLARHLSARDQIVGIHTFPRRSTHEILVAVEGTAAWIRPWQQGQRLTGNPTVDNLLEQFKLDVAYRYSNNFEFAFLRSEKPLNTLALSRRFAGIPGVRFAEPNGFAGDGDDIEITPRPNAWELTYSVGSGDCPAGCINRTYWTFWVDGAGNVTYLGKREKN